MATRESGLFSVAYEIGRKQSSQSVPLRGHDWNMTSA